ncbi:MAG: radical SAM protein [Clostridia bacterium]|nr:radical SAM protein [Clostridia bacterium]
MRKLVIPVFIPHLGCPHTCAFCNQKKIAGNYQSPTGIQIQELVELYTSTVKNKELFVELAFYGGSFTGIPSFLQEELLQKAWELKGHNKIQGIRVSTRPDYINNAVLERLNRYTVDTVELGVQSLDPEVLERSQRCHSVEDVEIALKLLRTSNIKVGIQLMPGLPGDTFAKITKTTHKVVELKPDFVRIYPTLVIKDTQLAEWFEKGLYTPLSLEEAIEISAQMAIVFERANIPIIRIGLQAQENLSLGRDLVAGPYHPAFGELVKARVFRKQLETLFFHVNKLPLISPVTVYCHPQEISQVKGQNKDNITYFKERYNLDIKVFAEPSLSLGFLRLRDKENNLITLSRGEFLKG